MTDRLSVESWSGILSIALDLRGARLQSARFGYAQVTCYSDLLRFPDYLEILVTADEHHLEVRSQSLLGFYDLGVNRQRVETLRRRLQDAGLVLDSSQTGGPD
ncbi:DUF1499 domain-containing protein [Marinobacter halodurans]|uniref:DUF1499 domain-containing protein n=1 Tax=Marinobacter halodurans TaxID=2528979 RepID=A0ABY1ZFJ1_9GAMM|nr:DUF1499 domain-containing protein [Marinobacter halodurans]